MTKVVCALCGVRFIQTGPGRPRRYCIACVPPGDKAASMRAWLAEHPDYRSTYNARRRAEYAAHDWAVRPYRRHADGSPA